MQTSIKPARRSQSGYALTIVLTFLLVTLVVFASIMYWVTSSARVTVRNNMFNTSEAAAQGAAEMVLAQMNRDFIYQSLNSSNVYMTLVTNIDQSGWPMKFTFSDTNGNVNQIQVSIYPQNWATNFQQLNSQFSGLFAYCANCDVLAVASPTNAGANMSAMVEELSQLAGIPVFQYGAFYNMDLDFSPGQPLTMNGKVHCNGTIWMYPQATATFNDAVEATVIVTNKDNPNDQQNLSSYVTPIHYNGGNPLSGVDTIAMPINGAGGSATNVEAILNLPPTAIAAPNSAAYLPTNQIYLFNECDLIISNAIAGTNGAIGTNITVYYQDKDNGSAWTQLTNNEISTYSNRTTHGLNTGYVVGTNLTLTASNGTTSTIALTTNYIQVAAGFPFVTNVLFYDYRESDTVQAVQLDIAKLNLWLNNSGLEGYHWNQICGGPDGAHGNKGHPIDSIYVYSSVPRTSSQLPAVRVINGQQLPSHWGLTVATPFPIYTLGNYNIQTNAGGPYSVNTTNTAYAWPAALMGDAITILSGNWNDAAYTNGVGYSSRVVTSNITVNAAMLEGIVPSTYVSSGALAGKHYSGGLENFLRLLETWGNGTYTLQYNGSIVVMFPSMYATNFWIAPGTYYDKPIRAWGFDANFRQQSGIPPCTPQAKAIIRGNWISNGR